jgi:predicted ArsR family transcriptional regulator
MSNTAQTKPSEIRERIVQRIELGTGVTAGTIEDDVAADLGVADVEVREQLIRLEKNGFVYTRVDEYDRNANVKTP